MSIIQDADAALGAALRIARGDSRAIDDFPNSEPAFWRSFAAILVVLPVDLVISSFRAGGDAGAGFLLAEAISGLVQWAAFPIIMIFVVRLLGLGARYSQLIISYNWSSILIVAVLLPSAVLSAMSSEPGGGAAMFAFASMIFVLWYASFLARAALDTGWINAIGIVMIDVLSSLLVNGLVFLVFGGSASVQ